MRIIAQLAPQLDVVHFEPAQGTASLAAPAIPFEVLYPDALTLLAIEENEQGAFEGGPKFPH
jgi:hypothetical protein